MLKSICLVTNELHPVTNGGCGTLVYNSIYEFLNYGLDVYVITDIEEKAINIFKKKHLHNLPNFHKLKIINIEDQNSDRRKIRSKPAKYATLQSYRFFCAIKKILDRKSIDIVEFPEYFGWAYHTIVYFRTNKKFKKTKIVVRFHLSMEIIDNTISWSNYGIDRFVAYNMERYTLQHCDKVIMPNNGVAEWANSFYSKNFKYVVSIPSLEGLKIKKREKKNNRHIILFYARLAPQKGAEIFVDAAVKLLDERKNIDLKFIVAGPDMNQAPGGGSITIYLKRKIPAKFKDKFRFVGNIDRRRFDRLIPNVLFAVMPTRVETFCYAVRELIAAGVPTIATKIPAFEDLCDGEDCILSDIGVDEIKENMKLAIDNKKLREKLENRTNCKYDFVKPYVEIDSSDFVGESEVRNQNYDKITIIVLAPKHTVESEIQKTIYDVVNLHQVDIIIAREDEDGLDYILGRKCTLYNYQNKIKLVNPVFGNFCIIHVGDKFESNTLVNVLKLFEKNRTIGFVGSVCNINESREEELPWDAAPELMPLRNSRVLFRCIIRDKKRTLDKKLKPQLSYLQEVGIIWEKINEGYIGQKLIYQNENGSNQNNIWVGSTSSIFHSSLQNLLSVNMQNKYLRLGEALKECIHDCGTIHMDIEKEIMSGRTPRVGGTRLNLKNLAKLTCQRILSVTKKTIIKH